MKIHYLQHVPFEGPAQIEAIARMSGADLTGTMLHQEMPLPKPADFDILAVMGGPMGVHDEKQYPWLVREKRFIEETINAGKKVIGICLGAQLIAEVMGAAVYKNGCREIGWFPVMKSSSAMSTKIGRALPGLFYAFHWHGDTFDIPEGAVHIAGSIACRNQGFEYDDRVVALQFHLEATPESVRALLENCRDELDGSEFVQSENDILKFDHCIDCNKLFEQILHEFAVG